MGTRIVVLDGHTLTAAQADKPTPAGEPGWAELADLGQLTVYPRTPRQQVVERAREADVVLTNKAILFAEELAALPRLRFISVLATGTNVVDLQAAAGAGVTVSNAPGYSTESVVQHVFALMLELGLSLCAHDRAARPGWARSLDFSFTLVPTRELAGQTMAIIGFGSIGRRVAEVAHAFGMRVATLRRPSLAAAPPAIPVEQLELEQLLREADVLTLHCPLTPETQQLINRERLALMKPSALLINTSRGPVVDEAALAEALLAGRLAGAGVDVLSEEPPAGNNPLLSAPHCVVTPHIAWATQAARRRLMSITVDNVRGYLTGSPVHVVAAP